jgi:hypothetical protein
MRPKRLTFSSPQTSILDASNIGCGTSLSRPRGPPRDQNLSKSSYFHEALIASAEGRVSGARPEMAQEYMH